MRLFVSAILCLLLLLCVYVVRGRGRGYYRGHGRGSYGRGYRDRAVYGGYGGGYAGPESYGGYGGRAGYEGYNGYGGGGGYEYPPTYAPPTGASTAPTPTDTTTESTTTPSTTTSTTVVTTSSTTVSTTPSTTTTSSPVATTTLTTPTTTVNTSTCSEATKQYCTCFYHTAKSGVGVWGGCWPLGVEVTVRMGVQECFKRLCTEEQLANRRTQCEIHEKFVVLCREAGGVPPPNWRQLTGCPENGNPPPTTPSCAQLNPPTGKRKRFVTDDELAEDHIDVEYAKESPTDEKNPMRVKRAGGRMCIPAGCGMGHG